MKRLLLIFSILLSLALPAQTAIHAGFSKLSRPEKYWVLFHPFVAKRAFYITKRVIADVDSVKHTGIIGTDLNGGKLDAFKHCYWMSSLSVKIGGRKAMKLGKAHEKGNYLEYKKRKLEDNILPDSVSCAMDLKNNSVGISSFVNCKTCSQKDLQTSIIRMIGQGDLFIIRKDVQGNYLTCDGKRIDMKQWAGHWGIPKCLVASNAP